MSPIRVAVFVALAAFMIPHHAAGGDVYFMTVYGSQRPVINRPCLSHTWATFIRISGDDTDPQKNQVQSFTISWLPQTLVIRSHDLRSEPGVNLNLQDTIAWCEKNRVEIEQFGPYQITPELWASACARREQLERGDLEYRSADVINLPFFRRACNCIYAVLDHDCREPAVRSVTLGFGHLASAQVARKLSPHIVGKGQTHPWVSELIGVCNYGSSGLPKLIKP